MTHHSPIHILNGDVLLERFPSEIEGEHMVMRECLVDGPIHASTLEEFYQTRATFIGTLEGCTAEDYFSSTVPEFKKMLAIPKNTAIYLWFEDDLFCQLNCWFLLNLLKNNVNNIYLVRPKAHARYGFGYLTQQELRSCFEEAIPLEQREIFANLWPAYKKGDTSSLLALAKSLVQLPFIEEAVQMHIDRLPTTTSLGTPKDTLLRIMDELQTTSFGPIFKEFGQRLPMYGFGDLQVKRLYNDLMNAKNND